MHIKRAEITPSPGHNIIFGISDDHINQLIQYTERDEFFHKHTSDLVKTDGSPGRFSSINSFIEWRRRGEGRQIFTLVNSEKNLAGIIWFGRKPLSVSGYQHVIPNLDTSHYGLTYAIRLYNESRGVRLAKPFTTEALNHFCQTDYYRQTPSQGIWLETDIENQPATSTYTSLGCTEVASGHPKGRVLMVFPKNC